MPRKHPLPQREGEICKRLRQFRLDTGYPRVAFARHAGIDSSALVRCEFERVAVTFGVFTAISKKYCLNPKWLAIGEGSPSLERSVDFASAFPSISPLARFSRVFDQNPTSFTKLAGSEKRGDEGWHRDIRNVIGLLEGVAGARMLALNSENVDKIDDVEDALDRLVLAVQEHRAIRAIKMAISVGISAGKISENMSAARVKSFLLAAAKPMLPPGRFSESIIHNIRIVKSEEPPGFTAQVKLSEGVHVNWVLKS
jgi:hypothetical protein